MQLVRVLVRVRLHQSGFELMSAARGDAEAAMAEAVAVVGLARAKLGLLRQRQTCGLSDTGSNL